jgi:hypothetical protein
MIALTLWMALILAGCAPVSPAGGEPLALTVEEYAIVEGAVDSPTHFEFNTRIPQGILDKRRAWREPSAEERIAHVNMALAPFNYRLVSAGQQMGLPVYDLHRGDQLVQAGLGNIWQVSVNDAGDDFALLADKTKGPGPTLLIRRESVENWDRSVHGFLPPVFAGQELVTVQQHGALLNWFTVKRGQRIVHLAPYRQIVANPFKGLVSWQGRWVLEIDGRVLVDGKSLNRQLGYDEVFNWRLLDGQPFYFFRKGKKTSVSYTGATLPYRYEQVIHYACCEPAAFNVRNSAQMLSFYALREGIWYYVEAGRYE